jgi:hypothetical protein
MNLPAAPHPTVTQTAPRRRVWPWALAGCGWLTLLVLTSVVALYFNRGSAARWLGGDWQAEKAVMSLKPRGVLALRLPFELNNNDVPVTITGAWRQRDDTLYCTYTDFRIDPAVVPEASQPQLRQRVSEAITLHEEQSAKVRWIDRKTVGITSPDGKETVWKLQPWKSSTQKGSRPFRMPSSGRH